MTLVSSGTAEGIGICGALIWCVLNLVVWEAFYLDGMCCYLLELNEDGGIGRRFNLGSLFGEALRLSWLSSKILLLRKFLEITKNNSGNLPCEVCSLLLQLFSKFTIVYINPGDWVE